MWHITLNSEDNSEAFSYDTRKDAEEGYGRLTVSALKHSKLDGIERWITTPEKGRLE
jgi:hypothetical protein